MKVIVNPHKLEIIKNPVNEKEINITKCEFEFAPEITNDYVKEAYFTLDGATYKQIIVNNECDIPSEVLVKKGQVELGVVAFLVESEEEIKRYNPSPAYFETWIGSLKDAENSEPITPSEMEQYEQALQDGLNDIADAVENAERLDIDVNKNGNKTTVEITKQNGTTKSVDIYDGEKGDPGINTWGSIEGDISSQLDLKEILDNKASLNDIKIDDIQIDGVSILNNKIANLPIADHPEGSLGLVRVRGGFGLGINDNGYMYVGKAGNNEIENKLSNYHPIVPSNLDYAIEKGLGNNSLDWTNTEKTNARNTIGSVSIDEVKDLISGLQSEITSENKLSSDLVDDTNNTNKFVSQNDLNKLSGIESNAQVNVQSNWNESDNTSDSYIQNKPEVIYRKAYTNPVIPIGENEENESFSGATVWAGDDGYWYATASGYRRKIMRSIDLVNWEYSGQRNITISAMNTLTAMGYNLMWGSQVIKINGVWRMYFSLVNETAGTTAIACTTAKSPSWNFEDPVIILKSEEININDCIEPYVAYRGSNDELRMFFGSTDGIYWTNLSKDGLSLVSNATFTYIAGKTITEDPTRETVYEGAFYYYRNGYHYLFASSGNYWDETQKIVVGRNNSTMGSDYKGKTNVSMKNGGGTVILSKNSKQGINGAGVGNQIITDAEGRTYMLYSVHTTYSASNPNRATFLQEIKWDENNWPYFDNNEPALSGLAPLYPHLVTKEVNFSNEIFATKEYVNNTVGDIESLLEEI